MRASRRTAIFNGGGGKNIVKHFGPAINLTQARYDLSAARAGNYAVFNAGLRGSTCYGTAEAVSTSFVKTTLTSTTALYRRGALSFDQYAFFAGGLGQTSSVARNTVDAYDKDLVRHTPSAFGYTNSTNVGFATVGNYALAAGGNYASGEDSGQTAIVSAYDTSLVKTNPTALSNARRPSGGSNSAYAIFIGDSSADETLSKRLDAYDTSLVRSYLTMSTTYPRAGTTGQYSAQVGRYAVFNGRTVDDALVIQNITMPSGLAHDVGMAFSFGKHAVFTGAQTVVSCDENLVFTTREQLSAVRNNASGVSIGKYALIAGGYASSTSNPHSSFEFYKLA